MKTRLGMVLAATALIGGASFLAIPADAQQGEPPAAARPADSRPAAPEGEAPRGPASQGAASGRPDQASTPRAGQRRQRPQMTAEDRAAFFDARLAAIRAGLRLTPEQEKMWPAVEDAARNLARTMADLREKARIAERPANAFERMKRTGEMATARGNAMTRMADAALPLWNSLSDAQKRRFPMLSRGMMSGGQDRMQARGRDRDDRHHRMMRRDRDERQHRSMRRERDSEHGNRSMGRGRGQDREPGMRRDGAGPSGERPAGRESREQRGDARGGLPFQVGSMTAVDRIYP